MIDKDLKNLVMSRLETMPDDIEISVGDLGSFSKIDLIAGVEAETEVGKKMIEIELRFMRDLINGQLYQNLE